jgi:hypothetical protein
LSHLYWAAEAFFVVGAGFVGYLNERIERDDLNLSNFERILRIFVTVGVY